MEIYWSHKLNIFGVVHDTLCCWREKCPQALLTKMLCLQQIVHGYAAFTVLHALQVQYSHIQELFQK